MISRRRAFRVGLLAFAATAAAAGITWQIGRVLHARAPRNIPSGLKSWKGGDLLACAVTVDGASLQELAPRYNVVMMCGIGGPADGVSDPAITVSDAFSIQPRDFEIEEALSAPMRVRLADVARRSGAFSAERQRQVEQDLWYELALLPKDADAFNVRTLSDIERFGGRLLLTEPRWSVISAWQP